MRQVTWHLPTETVFGFPIWRVIEKFSHWAWRSFQLENKKGYYHCHDANSKVSH